MTEEERKAAEEAARQALLTRRETRDMPMMSREAPITSVNIDARTAEMVWTTGAGVQRYDWMRDRYFIEELSLEPKAVRMKRLASGKAPLLDTHSRWDLGSVLGVVQSATLEKAEGRCVVKFSKRDGVEPIFQDVRDKIINNVSVGYTVYRYDMVPPKNDGELWRYIAVDWEPAEVSLVPIGADDGAGVRSDQGKPAKGVRTFPCEFTGPAEADPQAATPPAAAGNNREASNMTEEERKAAEAAEQKRRQEQETAARAAQDAAVRQAREAEVTRQREIREAVRMGGLDDAFAENLIRNLDTSVADAGLAVLREQAKRAAENPTRNTHVEGGRDAGETRRNAIVSALVLRINPQAKLSAEERETAREFRHMSLLRLAEFTIVAGGGNVRGLSGMEIAARAMNSTSDFPALLANVMGKRLRQGYDESMKTYKIWARQAPNAPDFKQMQVTQLGAAPDLVPLGEGSEFKFGTMSDGKETYSVATYGRIIALTRQAIVNDDLRGFDRIVTAFGGSAARLENRIVYGRITGNAAMVNDGVALFHATHGNLAGSGAAISVTSLGAGRSAMRSQKGLQKEELNIVPAYLIVPTAQEQLAYQYTSSQYVPTKPADTNEFRQGGRTALTPVVEPVLDANSTTAWYLACDANQCDTVEYCYLDGSEGAYLESEIGFDVDGMKVKARLDFAAKDIDFRGLYKNPGA